MKIRRLKVVEYKNIRDLELRFDTSLISLLIGQNGVGKSNLIEILALIFRGLDLCKTVEQLEAWPKNGLHFEYEIDYECKGKEIRIVCNNDAFTASVSELSDELPLAEISTTRFLEIKDQILLPDYIIGYYSGDNNRIDEIIRPYAEIAWDNVKSARGERPDFRRLFFLEDQHAQLILLTLMLYRGNHNLPHEFRERVDQLVKEYTNFEQVNELAVKLKNPEWYEKWEWLIDENNLELDFLDDPDFEEIEEQETIPDAALGIDNLEQNLLDDKVKFPFWGIKGNADKLISFFYDGLSRPMIYYEEADEVTDEVAEFIEFDSIDFAHIADRVFNTFKHAMNFFDGLDALMLVESLEEITLKVKHKYAGPGFTFNQLSEGERQLFTILGLLLITGKGDTLYLFDEPDTHLNPRWQRDYISLLRRFNLNDANSHIIVASHSPLLVQESQDVDLFLFHREAGEVVVDANNFAINNWRIDHVLASKYFDLPSTRPKQLDEYIELRKEILSQATISPENQSRLDEMANEYGTLPTGETIQEIKMQTTLAKFFDKVKDDTNQEQA